MQLLMYHRRPEDNLQREGICFWKFRESIVPNNQYFSLLNGLKTRLTQKLCTNFPTLEDTEPQKGSMTTNFWNLQDSMYFWESLYWINGVHYYGTLKRTWEINLMESARQVSPCGTLLFATPAFVGLYLYYF